MFVELETEKLEKYNSLNPIRSHIRLLFQEVEKDSELGHIVQDVREKLQPEFSRAIVFCNSRRLTEENAKEANMMFWGDPELQKKAGYYHAGMSAEERAEAYDDFQKGDILLLFATKAFGMGMDIPNIHYVYHFAPSSSFEDYLQEVGRGGRKASDLRKAGFSNENPIKAICFYHKESFRGLRDRMQKNQASWNDFCNAFEEFEAYRARIFGKDNHTNNSLPVPLNLLDISDKYLETNVDTGAIFKLSLYWLQKAGRIRATNYTPAYLEFKNEGFLDRDRSDSIRDPMLKTLYRQVYNIKKQLSDTQESTLVNGYELAVELKLGRGDSIYSWVLKAEKQGYLKLINEIKIRITKQGTQEILLKKKSPGRILQYLRCVQRMAAEILDALKEDEELLLDNDYLEKLVEQATKEILIDDFMSKRVVISGSKAILAKNYLEARKIKETLQKDKALKTYMDSLKESDEITFELLRWQREIIQKKKYVKRMRAAFYLLNLCGVKCSTRFSDKKEGKVFQVLVLTQSKYKAQQQRNEICQHANKLFDVVNEFTPKAEVNQLIIKAGLPNQKYEYTEQLLVLLGRLGYVSFSGGLVPMAINMAFDDLTPVGVLESDQACEDEYKETVHAKKLRLLVLEAFSVFYGKAKQTQFILDYFKKKDSREIAHLIEQHVPKTKANELLSAFRSEALKQRVAKLNPAQKAVYDANIRTNISVLAGPGTGKTHTLVLRVARLIQEENISPRKILVLAYNRAVVEELKVRLKDLFVNMGYKTLTNALQIHTFHSLVGKVLTINEQQTNDLQDWEDDFLKLYNNKDRRILKFFNEIEYAFVDEFQDITSKRLKILQAMAPPGKAFLTVIGDPNQSIYGFERINEGGSRSPKPYYEEFNKGYAPEELRLVTNYRSSQQIIDTSLNALPKTAPRIEVKAVGEAKLTRASYQKLSPGSWKNALIALMKNKDCKEVAVMFRSNEELYQAYPEVKTLTDQAGFELKIKGASVNFVKQREVAYVFDGVMASSAQSEIKQGDRNRLRKYIDDSIKPAFADWNKQLLDDLSTLFEYYFDHYNENSSYQDFVNFVTELTRRDDGQLMGLLKKANKEEVKPQVMLTTIHRVKGLEFQYVIVPPSVARLPFENNPPHAVAHTTKELEEIMDEEKRLLYVAFSRAKEMLLVEPGDREKSIYRGVSFEPATKNLGIPMKSGANNVVLSWKAWEDTCHQFIHNNLKVGQALTIEKPAMCHFLKAGGHRIEMFMKNIELSKQYYEGLYVSSIVRYTAEECQTYDIENNADFYDGWCQSARKRGYIYLVNFYGYAR